MAYKATQADVGRLGQGRNLLPGKLGRGGERRAGRRRPGREQRQPHGRAGDVAEVMQDRLDHGRIRLGEQRARKGRPAGAEGPGDGHLAVPPGRDQAGVAAGADVRRGADGARGAEREQRGHEEAVPGQHAEAGRQVGHHLRRVQVHRAGRVLHPDHGREARDAADGRPADPLPGAGRDVVDDQRHRRLPGQRLEVRDRALLARPQVIGHHHQRGCDLRPRRAGLAQRVGASAGVVAGGPGDQRRRRSAQTRAQMSRIRRSARRRCEGGRLGGPCRERRSRWRPRRGSGGRATPGQPGRAHPRR